MSAIKVGAAGAAASSTADREIVITRVFDAPREMVWAAVTDPQQVVQWWGPNGFTTTIHKMDVRPGGVWQHTMHGPDGTDYPNKSVFIELVKPERIVYSHGGGRKGAEGVSFQATWTFEEEEGGKTRLTMRSVFPSAAARDRVVKEYGAIEGGKQTLAKLADYLATMSGKPQTEQEEFSISRLFDAPRELVWKAFTEAGRMEQWWGPKGMSASVTRLDFRPGGTFLYSLKLPDGQLWWGKWVYQEIREPELLVNLSSFSDAEGNITRHPLNPNWPLEILHTATFTEQGGKTLITVKAVPFNASELECKVFAEAYKNMEQGFHGTWDKLDAYLAKA